MDVLFTLVLISTICLLGFTGNVIFKRTNISFVLILMLFGMFLGPIFKVIDARSFFSIAPIFCTVALIILLFEGSLAFDFYKLIKLASRATLLSTICFSGSALVVALIWTLLGHPFLEGLLLGVICGGTSSVEIMALSKKLKKVSENSIILLELEGAITDVFTIVFAFTIFNFIQNAGVGNVFQTMAASFSVGIMVGLLFWIFWSPIIKKVRNESFSYLVTLSYLFLIYVAAELVGGSGSLGILTFGILLANGKKLMSGLGLAGDVFELDEKTKEFHSLIAFIIQTFFFVFLGLSFTLNNYENIMIGCLLAAAIVFIRPFLVKIAMYKAQVGQKDLDLISIVLSRGLAAAVVAQILISKGANPVFLDVVFMIIFMTIIITSTGVFFVLKEDLKESQVKTETKESK
ncbi:MAG: cation:proton antiporter [archaeon]